MAATIIRPKDVSALGLIAQRPAKSDSRVLVNGLSPKARALGRALTGRFHKGTSGSRDIVATVTYLNEWAGGDRPVSASNGRARKHRQIKRRFSAKKKMAKRKRR